MITTPPHTWVALSVDSQALMLPEPDRIVAILYWLPAGPAEPLGGPNNGDLGVSEASFTLIPTNDPHSQLTIRTESEGAVKPERAYWPNDLLALAAEGFFDRHSTKDIS
jgi:hypothetical protein